MLGSTQCSTELGFRVEELGQQDLWPLDPVRHVLPEPAHINYNGILKL